jgi:hypothetical protein
MHLLLLMLFLQPAPSVLALLLLLLLLLLEVLSQQGYQQRRGLLESLQMANTLLLSQLGLLVYTDCGAAAADQQVAAKTAGKVHLLTLLPSVLLLVAQ